MQEYESVYGPYDVAVDGFGLSCITHMHPFS